MTVDPTLAPAVDHAPVGRVEALNLDAPAGTLDADDVAALFAAWAAQSGLPLYPAQEEALLELVTGSNVVLATPTGSGKSLVALAAHVAALADGRRTYYTAPIKALVSEKFFALCELLGPERVGMLTGDAAVNAGAPVVCCTAEILANLALRQGDRADVGQVVMDEFHFYTDPDRGWAWQVPLLELPQAQFLLMSATLGDMARFEADLTARTGRPTVTVRGGERPVPLYFSYATTPIHDTLAELLQTGQAPVYVVHFTQAAAMERAQALTSVNICSREQKDAIAEAIGAFRFSAGYGRTLSRLVRQGIGVHHAGMLPRYRRLVEQLAQAGLLRVICGTDTLGVGINVPIRTVLVTALAKYDGQRTRHLKAREFHQIAGRAGRAGYDTAGTVVVQAPDHEVENERLLARAGDDEKKRRRIVRKKPPEGFVSWTRQTFERLRDADPEPLTSSFQVTHAMVLGILARGGDPFPAMRHLIETSHEDRPRQRHHVRRTVAIVRALLAAGVVERVPRGDAGLDGDGVVLRLAVDVPTDFALNQPLSPFALAALELLDVESPTHALDVLSVIEATLEDPRPVVSAQRFKARGEAVAAMKAEGIEYDERMELLEDVEHPQPLRDLLDPAYETYRRGHPWVGDYELRPKAVARELSERAMTFAEYVSFHNLARSEGVVLRYLADAYRAMRQTVPEAARTEAVEDLTAWLGEVVRQTDSSLLDEWEALRTGTDGLEAEHRIEGAREQGPPPVTANRRAFRVLVRNAMFRRVELASLRRWDALADLPDASGWRAQDWQDAFEEYWSEHAEIRTDADARGPALFALDEDPPAEPDEDRPARRWVARQTVDDPAGDHDWVLTAVVDLDASDAEGDAVLSVTSVRRL